MYNRNFLQYFWINKIFLQVGGVLPFFSLGFLFNGIFIIMPIFGSLFLTIPGFYIITSRLKLMPTTKVLNIFCNLIEILVVVFKGNGD